MNWRVDGLAPPRRWVLLLLAAAIAALAVYLRLYHLGRPSFWHDEVFSLNIIDRPWGELWGIYFDVHPPLFYALLKTWLSLVGHDEYGLRLLSVLFSLATLPALYLIGRRIGGPWLGLATFLCLAVSPFAVDYAQELRSYAFFGCICAWALYGFTRLLAEPERAALPLRRSDRLAWTLVGGGSLLALYTHNLGLLLPFATTLVVAVAWWLRLERGRLALNWAIVHALALLLWVPWLPELWKQAQHVTGYSWIAAPSLNTIVETELSIAFGLRRYAQVWTWLTGAGLLSLAVIGAFVLPRRPRWAAILVALFVLPALGSLAITWLHRPVYLSRTLIWSGFPIAVLLGAGIVALLARTRGWRLALAVAVLLLLVASNSYTLWQQLRGNKDKDDWRDVARAVDTLVGPGDLVIVPGLGGDPMTYYLARYAEQQGKTAALVLDLETGLPKVGKQLWQAPDADRYLRVETPWRHPPAGLVSLIGLRFPCHRQVGRSMRSGMILWIYERDPACTATVPGRR